MLIQNVDSIDLKRSKDKRKLTGLEANYIMWRNVDLTNKGEVKQFLANSVHLLACLSFR